TLLRGARLLNGANTPILGLNLGRVGFLTTAAPDSLDWALDSIVRHAFTTEPRLTLQSTITGKGSKTPGRVEPLVLNDVVVHKGGVARVVRPKVSVDGDEVAQYSADGIIVSTPTGSTAYSMSAGGPIVVPTVDAIVVTAICPHTLAVRPLVLGAAAVVTVQPIPPWTDEVLVSFDGQVGTPIDRKSTRLNSSHDQISYAIFCLKKKNSTDYYVNLKALTTYSHRFSLHKHN